MAHDSAHATRSPGLRVRSDGRPDPGLSEARNRFGGLDLPATLVGMLAALALLILIGGLTDVCVHYTFADAHQRDYYVRVIEDCVGGSAQPRHDASLDAVRALDDARRRGLGVLPICPFVQAFIVRHPDYVDLVPTAQRRRFGLAAV